MTRVGSQRHSKKKSRDYTVLGTVSFSLHIFDRAGHLANTAPREKYIWRPPPPKRLSSLLIT